MSCRHPTCRVGVDARPVLSFASTVESWPSVMIRELGCDNFVNWAEWLVQSARHVHRIRLQDLAEAWRGAARQFDHQARMTFRGVPLPGAMGRREAVCRHPMCRVGIRRVV